MMTVMSIEGHPREEELADYAADMLAEAHVERLEAHVLECSVCARRLQRAASLQMALHEAVALEAEVVAAPPRPAARSWVRRHAGAVGALWASAAAVLLVLGQQGSGALELHDASRASAPAIVEAGESRMAEPTVTGCDPADPRCADGLLASIDPLQSVDPLSSWPDDPFFASAAWDDDDASSEGEPCGSGEDGGPLVCQPFSG